MQPKTVISVFLNVDLRCLLSVDLDQRWSKRLRGTFTFCPICHSHVANSALTAGGVNELLLGSYVALSIYICTGYC